MSGTNAYQKWADQAKALMKLHDATAFEFKSKLLEANTLLQAGQPPEVSNENWQGIQHYIAAAQAGYQTASQTKNMKKKLKEGGSIAPTNAQLDSMRILQMVMQTIAVETQQKTTALAQLKTERNVPALLDASGQAKLARLEDPAGAVASVEALMGRINQAASRRKALDLARFDAIDFEKTRAEAEQKIRALDLGGAQDVVADIEAAISAAVAEKDALKTLVATLGPVQAQALKQEGMRKLLKLETQFANIQANYESVLASAQQDIAKAEKSKSQADRDNAKAKKDMYNGITKDFPDIIRDWPGLPPKDKIYNNEKVSVARLQERLDSVGLKLPDRAGGEASLRKQRLTEWIAFRNDVKAKWDAYVKANYDRSLRGPFASRDVLTEYVKQNCAALQEVSVGGRMYRYAPSITAGKSMKTDLQPEYQLNSDGSPIMSFIYHLAYE